jgi:protein-S-isoprenylcysteine O-methyltransferase Ste14
MPDVRETVESEARPGRGPLQRTTILLFGVTVYIFFLATFVYFMGFVGNFFVPKSVDTGPSGPWWSALIVDLLLMSLFGAQHTIMARAGFKLWLTRLVPQPAERSTFVLAASTALLLMMALWKPIPGVLWDVSGSTLGTILVVLAMVGWGILFWSTFLINHFDLFGLRQVFLAFRNKAYTAIDFTTPVLYRYVRHPLYLGLLIALWATPTMTVGHLLLASGLTTYTLIGIRFEERELVRELGKPYREYQRQVSMLMPRPPKK